MSQRNKRDRKVSNHTKKLTCDCEQCSVDVIEYCKHYIECNLYSTSPFRLRNFHFIIDLTLFIFGALYVVFVPYTNHEESLNMQATHDLLFNGYLDWNSKEYMDSRMVTFAAAQLISLMILPFKFIVWLIPCIHLQQHCQYLIRFALLFLNITALSKFRQSFVLSYLVREPDIYILNPHNKYKSKSVRAAHAHMSQQMKIAMIQRFSLLFTALTIAQFHFLFYSSRLVPNCLTLPAMTIAFAHFFRNNVKRTSLWLAVSCVLYPTNGIACVLVPLILFFIRCKQTQTSSWILLCCGALVFVCIVCIMSLDAWLWNDITPDLSVFAWSNLDASANGFALLPHMLLINTIFIIFAVFKIHPMLFLSEFTKRFWNQTQMETQNNHKKSEHVMSLYRLIALFIDWESVSLLLICALFVVFSQCDVNRLLIVCPPLTLLSTIGCIRLFTLWGFKGFENANYSFAWFKCNLYERQKAVYFLWIPHHIVFSSVVKKLVSLDAPLTFITFRRYLKVVFKDIPREIIHKIGYRKQTGLIALAVSVSIVGSICFAFHQVCDASYDYPGGVAITLFPNIIENHKTNMILYDSYHDDSDVDMMEEEEEYNAHSQYYNHPRNHTAATRLRHRERENRAVHSKRGHRMNRDYTNKINASAGDIERPYLFHSDHKLHQNNPIFQLYDDIDCVHIGNLAAVSGVTRFLTPSFYEQYRFDTRNEIEMEEYALLKDPCNLYQEMYSKICANAYENDDEQYFERHDDYLQSNEDDDTPLDCHSSIDYQYPTIQGFDYLISEHSSVPGYYLIPQGVIYAKPMHSNLKSQILNLIHYIVSFFSFSNTDNHFLEPSLYVLKRQSNDP